MMKYFVHHEVCNWHTGTLIKNILARIFPLNLNNTTLHNTTNHNTTPHTDQQALLISITQTPFIMAMLESLSIAMMLYQDHNLRSTIQRTTLAPMLIHLVYIIPLFNTLWVRGAGFPYSSYPISCVKPAENWSKKQKC